MALQIAIVEDLQPDAQRLQALVRQELGAVECGIFPSGDAYLQQMPARKDDLVFLDICMEGTSGIETAQQLRRADPEVLIVFVTSSPEYVWDAFPVHPFDYLLKPYEEEKFRKLAAELRRVLCRTEPELEVRIARQTVQLPLRKVLYAMAQNHFVRVVSEDGECRAACGFAQVPDRAAAAAQGAVRHGAEPFRPGGERGRRVPGRVRLCAGGRKTAHRRKFYELQPRHRHQHG